MRPSSRPDSPATRRSRIALAASLTSASILILIGFLESDLVGWHAQALLVTAFPVLLILLSSASSLGRPLMGAMAVLWVLLGSSWVALIWLDGAGVPTVDGVPAVLWILVFGLTLLPLGVVSWVYASTFRHRERDRLPRTESSESRSDGKEP